MDISNHESSEASDIFNYSSTPNNETDASHHHQEWYRYNLLQGLALSIAYGLVFIIGFVGNVLVIIAVARGGQMMRHSATNIFLTNLAVADLLVIIICLPTTLITYIINPWILGGTICKLVPFFQGVSVCASVYSLVAVAVERCRSVRLPLNQRLSNRSCRIIIAFIWIAAVLVTSPWFMFFEQQKSPINNDFMICTEVWPKPWMEIVYYSVARLIFCYIVPLLIIVFCYALVCHRIWKHQIPGSHLSEEVERQTRQLQQMKLRALRMIGFVVAAFALAWLPFYITFMRLKLANAFVGHWGLSDDDQINLWTTVVPIAQWMSSANSCVNPFLYHFLDPRFRFRFRQMLVGRERQQQQQQRPSTFFQRRRIAFQTRMIVMTTMRQRAEPPIDNRQNPKTSEVKDEWV